MQRGKLQEISHNLSAMAMAMYMFKGMKTVECVGWWKWNVVMWAKLGEITGYRKNQCCGGSAGPLRLNIYNSLKKVKTCKPITYTPQSHMLLLTLVKHSIRTCRHRHTHWDTHTHTHTHTSSSMTVHKVVCVSRFRNNSSISLPMLTLAEKVS